MKLTVFFSAVIGVSLAASVRNNKVDAGAVDAIEGIKNIIPSSKFFSSFGEGMPSMEEMSKPKVPKNKNKVTKNSDSGLPAGVEGSFLSLPGNLGGTAIGPNGAVAGADKTSNSAGAGANGETNALGVAMASPALLAFSFGQ